jgi:hypothetical protein
VGVNFHIYFYFFSTFGTKCVNNFSLLRKDIFTDKVDGYQKAVYDDNNGRVDKKPQDVIDLGNKDSTISN